MALDEPELDFSVSVSLDPERTVITVAGELDLATSPDLQAAITEAVDRALPVVVDTSQVTFMDSTGLAGLLALRSDGASDLRFVLQRPSHAVRRILELTGITGVFEIDPAEPD